MRVVYQTRISQYMPVYGQYQPVYGPSPCVKWVERRKVAFGSLERILLVLILLESRLVSGVNIVVWWLQWGSPGSQMAGTWLLATFEVD